jgi:hypothetical protein
MSNVSLHMKRPAYLALAMALVAVALAAFCFLQLVVRKTSTENALVTVTSFIQRGNLSATDSARLNDALTTIRWNDRAALQTRFNLWVAGCLGFAVLAGANLFLAFQIDRTIFGGRGRGGAS